MKLQDVPQDLDPTYLGGQRLCYAVNDEGKYVQAQSSGWETERVVKDLAWKVIDDELALIRAEVRQGKASPLFYFMRSRQMDTSLLAENMGIWRWRVRRHLRAGTFRGLSETLLARYADCLEISPLTLKDYRGEDES